MKKKILFSLWVIFVAILQGCSWTEHFFIINNSSHPVQLFITLAPYERGFSIFNYQDFQQYPVNKKNKLNIEKPEPIKHDTLDAYYNIKMIIPPYKAVSIGYLNNQHYEKYNQDFFNDRQFNLRHIRLITNSNTVEIPDTLFDHYFIKENGAVKYFITPR
ncbi:MAG: hypothetical protein HND27_00965 [Bacteroidetes bacterium]|nr:hypothetical protein [Bacteroidota bacterium]MBV6461290.1 hypothetical protein [Flavobacteriales bacterium]WKZ75310.1 MAG: hypothetical protein QY303_00150 [Vicingaceae bacterium]MCL4816577.1 hypothetical protein [Flavobacteriales bacterium]NOG94327.1 hypothetical protein [Bacteroidota bacterium]